MKTFSHLAVLVVGLISGFGVYALFDGDDASEVARAGAGTRERATKAPTSTAERAVLAAQVPSFRPPIKIQYRDDAEFKVEVDTLNRDVDRLEDRLDREKNGIIQEWPVLTAENEIYQPAKFEENLNAVLEACDLQMEHFSLSCDEPPCIAAIRGPKTFETWKDVLACPEWAKRGYPLEAMALETEIQCPDGTPEKAFFISPYWREHLEETPDLKEERSYRTQKRWGEMYPSLCDGDS